MSKTQTKNINCLQGYICPKSNCKSRGPFKFTVQTFMEVGDEGTEVYYDVDYIDDGTAECCECHHTGLVKDFFNEKTYKEDGE